MILISLRSDFAPHGVREFRMAWAFASKLALYDCMVLHGSAGSLEHELKPSNANIVIMENTIDFVMLFIVWLGVYVAKKLF